MTPTKFLIMDYGDYMMMNQALSSFNNSLTNNANVLLASQTSREDRKFSERMSNLAWERNLEAWNMQNEYNLPANQYARQLEGLEVNGLNPNLVYGNSSAVSGAGGAISPYRYQESHSTAVPQFKGIDPYSQILSTRLLQTQVAAQEAQNRLINARADNEEARNPGIVAKSGEARYRWDYIQSNIMDDYDTAIRSNVSLSYWKASAAEYNAHILRDKSKIQYYEAVAAEWLNTTNVPGTDLTYKQYFEQYKAILPGGQYAQAKAATLNFLSEIAYRKSQGELLNLKKEYQTYVNKFAKLGRSLGNNWANLLLSAAEAIFGQDVYEDIRRNLPVTELEKDPVTGGRSEPGDW